MSKLRTLLVRYQLQPQPVGTWNSSAGSQDQGMREDQGSSNHDCSKPKTGSKQVVQPMYLRSKNERDHECLSDCLLHFTRET
jgi:hypothetical protein